MGSRRNLEGLGIVPNVVEEFDPITDINFSVLYGEKKIGLGGEVEPGNVNPQTFTYVRNAPKGVRGQTVFILIMTNPYTREGEYLHWMVEDCLAPDQLEVSSHHQDLIKYEAPKYTCTVVSTLFMPDKSPDSGPILRKNFSTKEFAKSHALGNPVGATYFTIIVKKDEGESSTCSTARDKTQENKDRKTTRRKRKRTEKRDVGLIG